MSKRFHVNYPLFLSDFNETLIFWTDFRKNSDVKFNQNPSIGSRVIPCGQINGWTDGHDKVNSCFREFAKAHENVFYLKTQLGPRSKHSPSRFKKSQSANAVWGSISCCFCEP